MNLEKPLEGIGIMQKQRQSNIELLRIFAAMGVVILHYGNPIMGGGITFARPGSVNKAFLCALSGICVCAVDLFVLLTGYFLVRSLKRDWWKPLRLVIQVIAFNTVVRLFSFVVSRQFSLTALLAAFLPRNYFVALYVATYIVSLYVNAVLRGLQHKDRKTMVWVLLAVFSIYPTLVDVGDALATAYTNGTLMGMSTIAAQGSLEGYTVVQFLLMYTVGAVLGLQEDRRYSNGKLLLGWVAVTVAITLFRFYWDLPSAASYCSPLVIAQAVFTFLLFKQMPIPYNGVINGLARASFSVYLIHINLLPYLRIEWVVRLPFLQMVAAYVLTLCGIYLGSYLIYRIWALFENALFAFLQRYIKLAPLEISPGKVP